MGFRKARDLNYSFLMKLAWGSVNKPEALWVQVMRAKHKCIEGEIPKPIRRNS